MLKTMAAALAALALVACGGGGGSSEPLAQSATIQQTPFIAVEYGDSTVEGLTPKGVVGPATPPATETQIALRLATGRQDVVVRQDGHGATGSADLLYGTDRSGLPWDARLAASGATVVAIRHGLNDNSMPVDDFRWVFGQLVGIAKAHGKTVVLETPTPMVDGVGILSNLSSIPRHDAKVQIIRDVAAATGVTLCDINARIRERHMDTLESFPDGIHPTPATYLVIGGELAKCLAPLVR